MHEFTKEVVISMCFVEIPSMYYHLHATEAVDEAGKEKMSRASLMEHIHEAL